MGWHGFKYFVILLVHSVDIGNIGNIGNFGKHGNVGICRSNGKIKFLGILGKSGMSCFVLSGLPMLSGFNW